MSYHSERVTLFSLDFQLDSFIREVVGQIAYNNPYNYIVILIRRDYRRLGFQRLFHDLLRHCRFDLILQLVNDSTILKFLNL